MFKLADMKKVVKKKKEWWVFVKCEPKSSQLKEPKGAFTPDVNEALHANDLHVKSMQRRNRQSCANLFI